MAYNNAVNEGVTGIVSRTSAGVSNGRTVTGTANQISVSNGDGTGGNPTLSLTSTIQVTGISFDSGTTALSTFTQGTFSPTIIGASTAGTQTYTIQVGRYQRVGRIVDLKINVATTANSGTGNTEIGALPFTTANNTNEKVPFAAYYSDSQTTTVVSLFEQLYASPNGTVIDTIKSIVAAGTTTSRAITATASLLVSGTIEV